MSEYAEKLKNEYEAQRGLYIQFTQSNEKLLRDIFEDGKDFYAIESRTKDIKSFEEKVDSPDKEQKYSKFSDVTDISGIRIICYLNEDVDKVSDKLRNLYEIDDLNSIDKESQLEPNQFGYRSRHFIVSYNAARSALPEFSRFTGLRAEIQVRTILQHAWAAIDWKLRYKKSQQAPQELRRKVFRISALLELADDEFSFLTNQISSLRTKYEDKIKSGNYIIDINNESIDLLFEQNDSFSELSRNAEKSGFVLSPNHPNARDPYGKLIDATTHINIKSIDDLKKRIGSITNSDINSFLNSLYTTWRNPPGRPANLVVTKAVLTRIALAFSLKKDDAIRFVEAIPFGEKLQEAILEVLKA